MVAVIQIKKGLKFHAPLADGNPEWEVTGKAGSGVWRAKCLDEDHRGEVRAFTDAQIRQAVGMARAFERTHNDNDAWYASQPLGRIVHYDDGFENWVRCEVVMGTTSHNASPHKCLKRIALCGKWGLLDLPRRLPDGTVYRAYHADKVHSGECFEPNFTNIYESGRRPAAKDPAMLLALDLSVPELDVEEAAKAKLWAAVKTAQAVLTGANDATRGARERLESALKVIQEAL